MQERQAAEERELMPDHPNAVALRNYINEIQNQIDAEDHRQADIYISQARQDWQDALQREQEDQAELRDQRQAAEKANALAVAYANLQADLERAKKQQDELQGRIGLLGVDKETGGLDIAVVEPAAVSKKPAKPEPKKTMAVAAALGLMLGVGLAIWRDRTDTRLRSSQAVVAALDLPVVGVMPHLSDRVQSTLAQGACQIIRRGINLITGEYCPRSLLLCSSDPRSGTSTLLRQLALSYARNGKSVLRIDAAPQAPSAQTDDSLGWRQILAGTHTPDALLQRSAADGIDTLPPGRHDPAAGGAGLEESSLASLLKQLYLRYQIVLIDGPAARPLGEACVWASVCDATLLVLSAQKADRIYATLAIAALRDVGANIIGVLVNRASPAGEFSVLGCRRMGDPPQSAAAPRRGDASGHRPSQAVA
jgi:Mrp family chromosome partitioning ATPase